MQASLESLMPYGRYPLFAHRVLSFYKQCRYYYVMAGRWLESGYLIEHYGRCRRGVFCFGFSAYAYKALLASMIFVHFWNKCVNSLLVDIGSLYLLAIRL